MAGFDQLASPFLHTYRARIIELASGARLPTIWQWSQSAEDGEARGLLDRQVCAVVTAACI